MRRVKEHTLQKLKYFKKYLEAYLVATKRLPEKYYIDAFAGTGKCIVEKTKEIKDGSTLIALKTQIPFDSYIFIEKIDKNLNELKESLKNENIDQERLGVVKLRCGDCNKILPELKLCDRISQYSGCFIFLDPEGPELFWDTIIYLSKIKKVDLLMLYPYDMALVRLVKNYPEKLDKFYGTHEWFDIYKKRKSASDAREKLLNFYINNLKKLGLRYTTYRQIRKGFREGKPLYHLILATRSFVGKKIMSQIFDKELDGQEKFKYRNVII